VEYKKWLTSVKETRCPCPCARLLFPAPTGRGNKRWCASDVCLMSIVYIGPKSRTETPRKTKIDKEVAHVTRDSDTTFKVKRSKVKGQGHQAALVGCSRTTWTTPYCTPCTAQSELLPVDLGAGHSVAAPRTACFELLFWHCWLRVSWLH